MLSIIFAALLSGAAHADQSNIVLRCNTPVGPDQSFKVEKTKEGLVLKELSMSGHDRDPISLSQKNFDDGVIILFQEKGSDVVTTVTRDTNGWWVESRGEFVLESGPADCY